MSTELCWLSAEELARRIRDKEVSPVEVVDAVLAQIDRVDPKVNAVITRVDEAARHHAREAEQAVMRGEELGPLHGVPITVKDLHLTQGVRTTLGSRLYENFVPDWDQPIVERLKKAGCIILGKTNVPEFGLIPLTGNSIFGYSNNPWKLQHNTGGSSGGSAAAVACGMGPIATASDGGGSIRVPAAFCGVFGIKPHMGRIPGVHFPRGWESLSHNGPITRSVRDAALMLDATSGPHPLDRWSLPPAERKFRDACTGDASGLRLAWSARLGGVPVEPEVASICEKAAHRFEELGCRVEAVELDLPDLSRAHQTIVICETATGMQPRLAEWEKVIDPSIAKITSSFERYAFDDLVRAHWAREEYWEKISPLFEEFDALLTPVTSITAPENGVLGPSEIDGQKCGRLAWLGFCIPFNMTWQPAASLPVGFDSGGLPVGLQVVGRRFDEWTVLQLASAFEDALGWADRRPPAVA